MVMLVCSFIFLGFYVLYSTSKRADLTYRYRVQNKIQKHHATSKKIGALLLLLSLAISLATLGLGTGFFVFLIALMTLASLVVLITPLRLFYKYAR